MFNKIVTYGYNDVSIMPARLSTIRHRRECRTLNDGMLPIFTAPMTTVIDTQNYNVFEENHIIPILPRTTSKEEKEDFLNKGYWVAYSLAEFADLIEKNESFNIPIHVLIDVANGNMEDIFILSTKAKNKFGSNNIKIMAGNIANPRTYFEYCKAGIDYVRCSVGTGDFCISSTQTGVHYGMVNLLSEMQSHRKEVSHDMSIRGTELYKCQTKIIADGGIRNYSDVIKALALGADYVMIGSLFVRLIESCADTYIKPRENGEFFYPLSRDRDKIEKGEYGFIVTYTNAMGEVKKECFDKVYKTGYGMASKQGQLDLFGNKVHTVEGTTKTLECITSVKNWSDNMKDYLASAMSYCGIEDVNDFNYDNVETYIMSPVLQNSINK